MTSAEVPGSRLRVVRVLHTEGCPNAAVARARVEEAAAGTAEVRIEVVVVTSPAEAAARGMRGSPSVLVDGRDPFTPAATPTGLSCRYSPTGDPVPSVQEIREALGRG